MTWSPQQYIQDGIASGIDPILLRDAVAQIEEVIVPHPEVPALLTLNHLAKRIDIEYKTLRSIIHNSEEFYRHFRIRKRSGGYRIINIPAPDLMKVQRWITAHILNHQSVHHSSFAFKRGASIQGCAARHVGARWLIKMDVAGFFGSISEIQVYRVFRSIGYQALVAFELARLTTLAPSESYRYNAARWRARPHPSPIGSYKRGRIGYLPQGAPSSPMLSNLVMRKTDAEIEAIARAAGVRYTRYSDDLTFSTLTEFDRRRSVRLVWDISEVLRRIGLRVNQRKTIIVPPGGRKIVLGLLVDGPFPRLPKDFRSIIRQHLYYLEKLGPFEHAKSREFDTVGGMYRHVRGLIDYANMIEPKFASEIMSRFERVQRI